MDLIRANGPYATYLQITKATFIVNIILFQSKWAIRQRSSSARSQWRVLNRESFVRYYSLETVVSRATMPINKKWHRPSNPPSCLNIE